MSARLLNLNNYESATKDNATLRIRPKMVNGVQPPDILLRGSKRNGKAIVTYADVVAGTAKWYPSVSISTEGTPIEYNTIVNWWFEQARADESYSESINARYEIIGDILGNVLEAKAWLIEDAAYRVNSDGKYPDRKSEINRYLKGWLNRVKKRVITRRR